MLQGVLHENRNLITWEFFPKPARPLSINLECSGMGIPNCKNSKPAAFEKLLCLVCRKAYYIKTERWLHWSSFRNLLGHCLSTRNVPGWTFQIGTILNHLHLKNNHVWYVARRTTWKQKFDYVRVPFRTCWAIVHQLGMFRNGYSRLEHFSIICI